MSEVEPNGEIFFLLREGTLIGSQSRAGVLRLIDSESKVDALFICGQTAADADNIVA